MARRDIDWNAGQSRKRARRAQVRTALILLAAYFLVLGGFYAVLRTHLLRVQAVNVQGVVSTDPALIRNALMAQKPGFFGSMAGFGNMLAWPTSLSSSTRALIPSVQTVRIEKSYLRRTITVQVGERRSLGVWCFTRNDPPSCFWFDQNGIAYAPALYTEGSLIPIVHDSSRDGANEGRNVLPDNLLSNFLAVVQLIQTQHIPMRHMDIEDLGKQEVSVPTYGGPTLRFSLRFAPANVAPLINELRAKGTYNGLQYVDLRSENRAFYQ